MSIKTIIQLALGFMRLANWMASRVDRAEWKRSGYNEAAAEYAVEWRHTVGIADNAVAEANSATPAGLKAILESDL